MSEISLNDSGKRMGRKPLTDDPDGAKFVGIRLPVALWKRIETLAGPGRVSRFMREAAEEKAARMEADDQDM